MAYSVSMDAMIALLERRKPFRIKLPASQVIYYPDYIRGGQKNSIYCPGDIVCFSTMEQGMDRFFIGQIRGYELVGNQKQYIVTCIKRCAAYDPDYTVNFLAEAKIFNTSILCLLNPEKV